MKDKQLKARVGIYSAGLKAYWDQFEGLRERLICYGEHLVDMIGDEAEVFKKVGYLLGIECVIV